MAAIRAIDANRQHVEEMSDLVSAEHRAVVESLGTDVRKGLLTAIDLSCVCKAFYVDGQLIAVGGATGTLLEPTAGVWLAISRNAHRYPILLVRQIRRQIADLLLTRHELHTIAFTTSASALRLLVLLGFHGTDFGPGAVAYTRRDRRRLLAHLNSADVPTVPLGIGKGIPLRYEPARPIWATAH